VAPLPKQAKIENQRANVGSDFVSTKQTTIIAPAIFDSTNEKVGIPAEFEYK